MIPPPTRLDLALQIASAWDLCAHHDENQVCVAKKGHGDEHKYEPIESLIPFE